MTPGALRLDAIGRALGALGVCVTIGWGVASPAAANSTSEADPWSGVEEMVVVSSGSAVLTEVATSSALGFDAEDLKAEGINDIRDIAAFTPNLEIKTAFAAVNPTLFIRGVGLDDFNANSASAVSVYQDGYYMNSPAGQLFGLFDVEAVEVLRGPQPLRANASAGAIMVRSKKPSDDYEAYLTSTFGNYNLKAFQGALNVPVVPGLLAVRTAFNFRQRDGITENVCPKAIARGLALDAPIPEQRAAMGACRFAGGFGATGFAPGPSKRGADDVNNVDNWAARGMAAMQVPLPGGQEMEWLFALSGGQNNSLATQYQHTGMQRITDPATGMENFVSRLPINGRPATDEINYTQDFSAGDNFKGEYDRVGDERLDLLGGSLTGSWKPTDRLEIESLSGYFWHDRETFANDDGGPNNWLNDDFTDEAWQFTQELRLGWQWGDDNDAGIGGYYLTETLDSNNIQRNNRPLNAPTIRQEYQQETTQWALFGSTHIAFPPMPGWGAFAENFSLDASVRYNWAEKTMENDVNFTSGGGQVSNPGSGSDNWDAWIGDVVLTYTFDDQKSVYAKWSRGWKPGHFNAATTRVRQSVTPVSPETVDSVEGGLRATWFDGRLSTNITGFLYNYRDLQVFQVTADSDGFIERRLINSDEAEVWGIEWELEVQPLEGLTLGLNGGYLSSEYKEFSASFERSEFRQGEGLVIFTREIDYSGNRLLASPEWSLSGSAQYEIPLLLGTNYGTLTPRFSFAYRDDVFFDANEGCGAEDNIPECLIQQPAYWIFNAALTYRPPEEFFELMIFVRNFMDKEYKVQSFDLTSTQRLLIDVYGDPRTFGGAVTFRF